MISIVDEKRGSTSDRLRLPELYIISEGRPPEAVGGQSGYTYKSRERT
jgi:hypothetical protein